MPADLLDLLPLTGYGGAPSPRLFVGLLLLSTLLDGAVVFLLLFRWPRPGHRGITATRLLGILVVFGLLFPIKARLLAPFHVTLFGMLCILWYDLVFVLPSAAAALLVRSVRRGGVTRAARLLTILPLAFLPVAGYARWIEPYDLRLETSRIPIDSARVGDSSLRIVVLADLQTDEVGDYEREAIDLVLAQQPDLILIPGDLYHGNGYRFEQVREELRDQLARLKAPGGVWFVRGDVDPEHRIGPLLEGTGIRRLRNEIVRLELKGRKIALCGVDRDEFSERSRRLIGELESLPGDEEIRILMAHHPDVVTQLSADSRVDLTVAGHTHGGQVVIPFFGPPITLSSLPRDVASGGSHLLDGNRLYLSRGVGHERTQAPRIRFLSPPELSVLILEGGDGLE